MADAPLSRAITLEGLNDIVVKVLIFETARKSLQPFRLRMDTGSPDESSGVLEILFDGDQHLAFHTGTKGKILYELEGPDARALFNSIKVTCHTFNLPLVNMLARK